MNDLLVLDETLSILNGQKESIEYLYYTFTNEYIEFKSIIGDNIIFENANIKEKFNKIIKTVKEKIRNLFEKFVKIIKSIKIKVKEIISNIKYKLKFSKYDEFIDDEDEWNDYFEDFEDEFFEDRVPVDINYTLIDNETEYTYDNLIDATSEKHGFGFMGAVLRCVEDGKYDEAKDITNRFISVCKSINIKPEYVESTGNYEKDIKIAENAINTIQDDIYRLDKRCNSIEKDIKEYENFEKYNKKDLDQWTIDNIKAWQVGGNGLVEEMNMCYQIISKFI